MYQTLFYIPETIYGVPLFGAGLLLAIWAVVSVVLMAALVRRQGLTRDTYSYLPILLLIGAAIWLVLPALGEPMPASCQQVAFRTVSPTGEPQPAEGLPIRGYGVMLLLAVVAAVALAAWRARRVGLDPELIFSLAFWAIIPGILGARVFHVTEYWFSNYWPIYQAQGLGALLFAVVNVAQGGLVAYGSLIGGVFGIAMFLRRHRLPALATLDLITPSLMLGLAIGRVGCLLNGCCFGAVCDASWTWSIRFPPDSQVHIHQIEHGQAYIHGMKIDVKGEDLPKILAVEPGSWAEKRGLKAGDRIAAIDGLPVEKLTEYGIARTLLDAKKGSRISIDTADGRTASWPAGDVPQALPVYPTQVYSSISALLLCLFLLAYDPFRRRDGELWAMFLTLYPIARFLVEVIRDDEPKAFFGLTISQLISLIMLACAAVLWVYLRLKPPGTAFASHRQRAER